MIKRIFRSPDGRLRFFWSQIIYLVLFFVIVIVKNNTRGTLTGLDKPGLIANIASALIFIGGIFGLTRLFRGRLDRRSWAGMALPGPRGRWKDLLAGSVWVLILMPAPLLIQALVSGEMVLAGTEPAESGWLTSVAYLLGGYVSMLAVGFSEELAVRGYIFQNLAERYPLWIATAITGLIFGLYHFWNGISVARILNFAAFSTVLVVLRLCTGSLWASIGLHSAYNWVYSSLLGFSSCEVGYNHILLHFETSLCSEAAPPIPWLGDIGSIMPNLIIYGIVISVLLIWNRMRKRPIDWRVRLDENGEVIPLSLGKNSGEKSDTVQTAPAV